ncbi:fimbrial biogenesis chaperone [Enterobacter ludwigii]|uniref:fimbrial biogenesis chaperone n=1 Tax=Enterobacter ludwigii TaxID=299767 RepID=UPI001867FE4F|nr:molecular chaperone [Enterobacter ludwigii]
MIVVLFLGLSAKNIYAEPVVSPSPSVSLVRDATGNSEGVKGLVSNKKNNDYPDAGSTSQDVVGNKKGLIFFPMQIEYSQQENTGGVVVNVVNPATSVYLLQSTVSAFDADTGRAVENKLTPIPPFVVLPPLRRLEGEGRVALRIRQAGGQLPTDRETAAIVSVKAIPSAGQDDSTAGQASGSRVQIALRMNMRLFWRPAGVSAPDYTKIVGALMFSRQGKSLVVSNPTPWFVHFSALSAGGVAVTETSRSAWVSPKSSHTFDFTQPVADVLTWTLSGDNNEHQTRL